MVIKTYGVDVHKLAQGVMRRNEIHRKLCEVVALTADAKACAIHQLASEIQCVIDDYLYGQAEEERPITHKVVFAAPGETP